MWKMWITPSFFEDIFFLDLFSDYFDIFQQYTQKGRPIHQNASKQVLLYLLILMVLLPVILLF